MGQKRWKKRKKQESPFLFALDPTRNGVRDESTALSFVLPKRMKIRQGESEGQNKKTENLCTENVYCWCVRNNVINYRLSHIKA